MRVRYGVLAGLFLLAVITYLDRVCIAVASVRMQKDLDLGPAAWGWVLGAFTLSYGLFEIPTGAMGDRTGTRRTLTRIVLWWSAFTALTGAARSFLSLLLVRFAFGAGEAGAFPNASATVSRWFPQGERARAVGLVWLASRVGGALSPNLVVPLQQRFGWRTAFVILGCLGVVWAIGWYAWFRDRPDEMKGISAREREEIGDTPPLSHGHSLPWNRVLRAPNFWLILVMYHAYCWGSYFYISWMPTYLQTGRGFSENELALWAALPFVLSGAATISGGWLSDWLVPRIGLSRARRSIGVTGLLLGGAFLATAAAVPNNQIAALFLALGYGCMDAMLPVSWAVCLDVGGPHAGAISAAMNTAGQAGSFLSTVAFGYAVRMLLAAHYPARLSYSLPLFPLAAMLILSAFCFLRIDPTRSLTGPDD